MNNRPTVYGSMPGLPHVRRKEIKELAQIFEDHFEALPIEREEDFRKFVSKIPYGLKELPLVVETLEDKANDPNRLQMPQ